MSAPKLQALIGVYLRKIQELRDELTKVHRIKFIDEATGIHLDALGNLVGRARLGLSDEQYRIAIRTQILVNLSDGTYSDLVAIFKAALGQSTEVRIVEYGNAEMEIVLVPQVETSQVALLRSLKQAAKAAGVRVLLSSSTTSPEFAFAGGDGAGFGVGGFRSVG